MPTTATLSQGMCQNCAIAGTGSSEAASRGSFEPGGQTPPGLCRTGHVLPPQVLTADMEALAIFNVATKVDDTPIRMVGMGDAYL